MRNQDRTETTKTFSEKMEDLAKVAALLVATQLVEPVFVKANRGACEPRVTIFINVKRLLTVSV